MNPKDIFCPNIDCPARGQIGKGNIRIHSQREKRYVCHECDKTFTTTKGTIFYRLRTDPIIVMQVITLLAYGSPIQAIVHGFGLDERTVKDWWQRAGNNVGQCMSIKWSERPWICSKCKPMRSK
jgi:transposase-like protein